MADAAPLIGIPEAPVPAGGEGEWFKGVGGVRLRAAFFRPRGKARGTVFVSPGRTEPIEKYFEVASDLLARKFCVVIHDWRGQGLSDRILPDRLAGHANGFHEYVGDFEHLLHAYEGRAPKPWIGMGHSMGACLVLLSMIMGDHRLDGAVLSAPMFDIYTAPFPGPIARAIAWSMVKAGLGPSKVHPGRDPFKDSWAAERLTHDHARYLRHKAQLKAEPDLAVRSVTWGWLEFALRACDACNDPERLSRVKGPVTIVAPELDRLCPPEASRKVADLLPKGRFVEVPGSFHEILVEVDDRRALFWKAFDETVDQIAPAAPTKAKGAK